MRKRREEDAQGLYHRQMLHGPAQLEEAGDVTALEGVLPTPLGLCGGERRAQVQPGLAHPHGTPLRAQHPAGPPHPPGSRSGTRCSTCCGCWFSRSPRCSPTRCRPGARGWTRELQAGTGRSAHGPGSPQTGRGGDRPQALTLLGHKLRGHSHLKGGEDGRVVTGRNVIGAAWMVAGSNWVMVPEPRGPGQRWPPRAAPSPRISLTIGVTDHVGFRM